MRLPRVPLKSPNPLILLIGALVLMAWSVCFEKSVNGRRAEILDARAAYLEALTRTKTQLAGSLGRAVTDTGLAQNLKWKLDHSVKRTLKTKLTRGGMDQLTIFDGRCRVLAEASLGPALPMRCPLESPGKGSLGSFSWTEGTEGTEGPMLVLSHKMTETKSGEIYATGAVHLDGSWLELHPELNRWTKTLGLTIGLESKVSGTVLVEEGRGDQGKAVAVLGAKEDLGGRFDDGLSAEPYESGLFWPGFLLALSSAFVTWWRHRTFRFRTFAREREIVEWARSLSPLAGFTAPGKGGGETVDKDGEVNLKLAQRFVSQALQTKIDSLRGANRKRDSLEKQVIRLEKDIQSYEKRLAELAELDSLAIQLKRTTGPFLSRMDNLHADAEDLSDLTGGPLAERMQTLVAIFSEWRHGIAERGARKFLRSLSETAGHRDDSTALDDQLELIQHLSEEIRDQALAASLAGHRIVEASDHAARIAGLWHGLALSSGEEGPTSHLALVAEDAQAMLQTEEGFKNLAFKNLIADGDGRLIPPLPRTIWVTALYHVYLAMAELAAESPGARIATRLRRDGDRMLCVISLVGGTQENPVKKRAERQAYNLEVSRAVLAPYELKLSVLPALSGPFPVALSWAAKGLGQAALLSEGKPLSITSGSRPTSEGEGFV